MKKSTIEKIEKEIDEKTKTPYLVREKIKNEVFTNFVIASIIILYFIFIILGSFGTIKNVRIIDINIFSIIFLGTAILLFEIAYRKDDGKLAMFGIESLAVAIFTLFLPYIIFELHGTNKKYYLMVSIFVASYYIIKSIYSATRTKNKYMKDISDIKDIVKKEKKTKRIKEDIEEVEEIKYKINVRNIEKSLNKEIKENVPKRRGKPRKTETTNVKEKSNEEVAPKKRGRPRKAVTSND